MHGLALKQRHVHRLTDESCTIDMVARLLSFPDHDRPTISAVHSSLDPRRSKKKIGEQLLSPRPRLVSGPETPPTCTRCACGGRVRRVSRSGSGHAAISDFFFERLWERGYFWRSLELVPRPSAKSGKRAWYRHYMYDVI